MDKHFTIHNPNKEDECLITNNADDVIGVLKLRPYDKEESFPVLQTLLCGMSDENLKNILSEYVKISEAYDKCSTASFSYAKFYLDTILNKKE